MILIADFMRFLIKLQVMKNNILVSWSSPYYKHCVPKPRRAVVKHPVGSLAVTTASYETIVYQNAYIIVPWRRASVSLDQAVRNIQLVHQIEIFAMRVKETYNRRITRTKSGYQIVWPVEYQIFFRSKVK